jgi:hypothetical protein
MESIIVTANNKKELSLVKLFLKQTKIKFHTEKREENPEEKTEFTKEEFGLMLDRARKGKGRLVTDEYIKSLL